MNFDPSARKKAMYQYYARMTIPEFLSEVDMIRRSRSTRAVQRDLNYMHFKYATHEQRKAWLADLGEKIEKAIKNV